MTIITLSNLTYKTQQSVTFEYVSVGFAVFTGLLGLTLLAMFLNKNQIYSVLYLGLLSLLAIVMWMYYLEVNFILIVYILAFIGAIVMLFLSVVLMLPSSALEGATQFLPWVGLVVSGGEPAWSLLWNNPVLSTVVNLFAALAFIGRLGGWALLQDFRAKAGPSTTTSLLRGLSLSAIVGNFHSLIQQTYASLRGHRAPTLLALAWGRFHQWRSALEFFGQVSYKFLYSTVVLLATTALTEVTAARSNMVYSENLISIKNTLYVDQPLLLLVSVLGLLIALFGVTAIALETRKVLPEGSVLEEQSWSLPTNCGAGQSVVLASNNNDALARSLIQNRLVTTADRP